MLCYGKGKQNINTKQLFRIMQTLLLTFYASIRTILFIKTNYKIYKSHYISINFILQDELQEIQFSFYL